MTVRKQVTVRWLSYNKRIPGGWRLLRPQRRTHHHMFSRLIYKI